MSLFRPTRFRVLFFLGLSIALGSSSAFGQPPSSGIYTYRYGYNPGYYGSSAHPVDPGAKPGQAIVPRPALYRWLPSGPPAAKPASPPQNPATRTR
jgi:hypothetical protein